METPEPVVVETEQTRIVCDGGGTLGHPKVYLAAGKDGTAVCPYCSRRFVLRKGAQEL